MSCQTKINPNCPTFWPSVKSPSTKYCMYFTMLRMLQIKLWEGMAMVLGWTLNSNHQNLSTLVLLRTTFGSKITQCSGENEGIYFRRIQWYTEVYIQWIIGKQTNEARQQQQLTLWGHGRWREFWRSIAFETFIVDICRSWHLHWSYRNPIRMYHVSTVSVSSTWNSWGWIWSSKSNTKNRYFHTVKTNLGSDGSGCFRVNIHSSNDTCSPIFSPPCCRRGSRFPCRTRSRCYPRKKVI